MVRGSTGSRSDTAEKEPKKDYDGTIAKWPAGKVKLQSSLHKAGLLDVAEHGPSPVPALRRLELRRLQRRRLAAAGTRRFPRDTATWLTRIDDIIERAAPDAHRHLPRRCGWRYQ